MASNPETGPAMSSCVGPTANSVGVPTRIVGSTHDIKLRDGSGASAYPRRRHFHRGYLPETVARWIAEFTPNQN